MYEDIFRAYSLFPQLYNHDRMDGKGLFHDFNKSIKKSTEPWEGTLGWMDERKGWSREFQEEENAEHFVKGLPSDW